jgi:hypothetical protein
VLLNNRSPAVAAGLGGDPASGPEKLFRKIGIKIECLMKKLLGVMTMKRNKRTTVLAHEDLAPLTEHILAAMGKEGHTIRKRLKNFYRTKATAKVEVFDAAMETQMCEGAGP